MLTDALEQKSSLSCNRSEGLFTWRGNWDGDDGR